MEVSRARRGNRSGTSWVFWVLAAASWSQACPKAYADARGARYGQAHRSGVMLITGADLKPFQTQFEIPEIADPYVSFVQGLVVISGTAQYALKFEALGDVARGGPYQIEWNDFFYGDGTPMEGGRLGAHSWDMKPVLWSSSSPRGKPRLWHPARDSEPPLKVWYGGHMRPSPGKKVSAWPADNFSRDVFAFIEKAPGKWFSMEDSLFSREGLGGWPRPPGNFLGHRYGHQIVMPPGSPPLVFYEEVTQVRADGAPQVTGIFVDEMATPFEARGKPQRLITPVDPVNGRFYPSTVREDGSALVEGPLYFRFRFEGELWEAIGFSAGSFYGRYPSCFASRRVSEGRRGKPYRLDLNEDGTDLHDAGRALGTTLNLAGGPGRPSVIVDQNGNGILDAAGKLQILFHAYRRDVLPDHEFSRFPVKYGLHQMFRGLFYASLTVKKGTGDALRFQIAPSRARPSVQTLPVRMTGRNRAHGKSTQSSITIQ